MILARCPHCETTFRAEPDALKQRAGKVRCGKCRRVFNALDYLQAETSTAPPPVAVLASSAFVLTPPPSPDRTPTRDLPMAQTDPLLRHRYG